MFDRLSELRQHAQLSPTVIITPIITHDLVSELDAFKQSLLDQKDNYVDEKWIQRRHQNVATFEEQVYLICSFHFSHFCQNTLK